MLSDGGGGIFRKLPGGIDTGLCGLSEDVRVRGGADGWRRRLVLDFRGLTEVAADAA